MSKQSFISKEVTLAEICLNITDGKHGDCEGQLNSGYFFLSAKDIYGEKLNYDSARQITKQDFLETHKRTRLEPNDIVFTNSGTIGRMAIVKDEPLTERCTFQKSVAIIKPDQNQVISSWLYYYLSDKKEDLIGFAGGTAQKNLLLRDLRSFKIQLSPLNIQRKVAWWCRKLKGC